MMSVFKKYGKKTSPKMVSEEDGLQSFLESQVDRTLLRFWSERCIAQAMVEDLDLKYAKLQKWAFSRPSQGLTSLQDELAYTMEYISVYQQMSPGDFYVNFVSKWAGGEVLIPAFTLIPLIQNAFIHGYCSMEKYPVKVWVSGSDKILILEVSNRVNHHIEDQRVTAIIHAFTKRLTVVYPERHHLLFNSNSNTFKASLTLEF